MIHTIALHVGLLLADAHAVPLIFLLVVGVLVVLAMSHHLLIVVAHFFNPHVLGFFGVLVGLFLLFAVFFVRVRVAQPPQQVAIVQAMPDAPEARVNFPDHMREFADRQRGATVARRGPKDADLTPEAAPETVEETTHAVNDKTKSDSSGSPPSWTKLPPHKHLDTFVMVVHLDADTNPAVRDDMLDQKMLVTAEQYIDEHLYPDDNVSKVVHLTGDYVHSKCCKDIYPDNDYLTAGQEVFARLEFDGKFRAEVDHRYRTFLSAGHLQQLSIVSLMALVLMGGLYAYLRSSTGKRSESEELEVPTGKA